MNDFKVDGSIWDFYASQPLQSMATFERMARVRTRMPTVFVGHPFGNRFPKKAFRQIFKELPFSVKYSNTDIETKHLLTIIKDALLKADYAIFDISNWNPNVALELGIAEGLHRAPLRQYYILLNTRRSKEVPSDIRGLQRLEYTSYDFKVQKGLGDQLLQILAKEYWVKKIWKEISGTEKAQKKNLVALRILAHFRDHIKLTPENLKSLSRGTHLRRAQILEIIEVLLSLKLIKKLVGADVYSLRKALYAPKK